MKPIVTKMKPNCNKNETNCNQNETLTNIMKEFLVKTFFFLFEVKFLDNVF